jgi:hypothetical protein
VYVLSAVLLTVFTFRRYYVLVCGFGIIVGKNAIISLMALTTCTCVYYAVGTEYFKYNFEEYDGLKVQLNRLTEAVISREVFRRFRM